MRDYPSVGVTVKLEFLDAFRASLRLVARQFFLLLVLCAIVATLAVALFIFAVVNPMPARDWYETAKNPTALYWAAGLPLLIFLGIPLLTARKLVTDERVRRGFSYQFSDTGIHVEGSVSRSDLTWEAIKSAREYRWGFLLFPAKNVAINIPRRCIANACDASKLRELLRAHV